ncbi:MAG TPA: PTS sugar transporter subunit IIA [Candidatus Mcinerneyibacteriales bacterium]|nr:PTS sugar transporter subunit IIA [Candidatus Mcinerneyibacteriota bacterium]HOO59541.1 PTS sugar transporter subunit IIA [Candidatus Mcinerneyibacteriales bacterium]HPJ69426.1 PTS sugar transporter subunit IIA [Candidatus Mcinerneyibacteriales bacterium]
MLQRFLDVSKIFFEPKAEDKEALFQIMGQKALDEGWITSVEEMNRSVRQKESEGIVELKPHIVLPHARGSFVNSLFALVAYSPHGIPYEGAKGKKAELVFYIGVPEGDQNYLKLLASISRLVSNDAFLEDIKQAELKDDILYAVKKYCLQVKADEKKQKKYFLLLSLNHDIEEAKISSFFAEIGAGLVTELQGRNLSAGLGIFSYFTAMGFGQSRGQYNKVYFGVTDDERAAAQLNLLLKQEGIDLKQAGLGTLIQVAADDVYGGIPEDIF